MDKINLTEENFFEECRGPYSYEYQLSYGFPKKDRSDLGVKDDPEDD
jgi:hypothetical protein